MRRNRSVVHYETNVNAMVPHLACNMWVYENTNGHIVIKHTADKSKVTCKNCLRAMKGVCNGL